MRYIAEISSIYRKNKERYSAIIVCITFSQYCSNLHNFKFTHEGLRVWKAFNVGPGKFIPWNDIVICPQTKTNLLDEIPFFPNTAWRFALKKQSKAHVNEEKIYQCTETSCTEEFQSQADLDLHMNLFDHRTMPQPVSECLYEKLRRDWVDHFQTLTLQSESSSGATAAETESLTSTSRLQMGWALQKKHASVRFPQKVREYLTQKFNIGQDTGKKEDPAQVAKDMRAASTMDGERMFDRTEWLSKCQIQGFFSRLSANIKQGGQKRIELMSGGELDIDTEEHDDLAEEYACELDE